MSRQLKLVFSAADRTGSRSRPRLNQDDPKQSAESEPATFEPPPPKRQKQGEIRSDHH